MNQNFDLQQHRCPKGRPDCSVEGGLCGDCLHKILLNPEVLESVCCEKSGDVNPQQKFSSDSLKEPVICESCNKACGSNEDCVWCQDFLVQIAIGGCEPPSMQRPQQTHTPVGGGGCGGGSAYDVPSMQRPQEMSGPVDGGSVCVKCDDLPFTMKHVQALHNKLYIIFHKYHHGKIFNLCRFDNSIGCIKSMMNNSVFSAFILMLSSCDAGLNSINQLIFSGYLIAVMINHLQTKGECDSILVAVFCLELENLSGNSDWSNCSKRIEFRDLFDLCVEKRIILNNGGSSILELNKRNFDSLGQVLVGMDDTIVIEADKWVPKDDYLDGGILSSIGIRYSLSAVVLKDPKNNSFVILFARNSFWLIDGKEEQSIRELSISEFKEMCVRNGCFYYLNKIPLLWEDLELKGNPTEFVRRFLYNCTECSLYDDGTFFFETTGITVHLAWPIFMTDISGRDFRVIPPPRPDSTAQILDCSPPPSQSASCAQVGPDKTKLFDFTKSNLKMSQFKCMINHTTSGTWNFRQQVYENGPFFKASGTLSKHDSYSDTVFEYGTDSLNLQFLILHLTTAYKTFLEQNSPK